MIKYITDEYSSKKNDDEEHQFQNIHCLFCGKQITPEIVNSDTGDTKIGDCDHIIYVCTNETWEEPEISKQEIFKDFNEEYEYIEHLEKTLDDSYLLVISAGHHLSPLDAFYLFKQK